MTRPTISFVVSTFVRPLASPRGELLRSETLARAIEEQVAGVDCVMNLEGRMALGFALSGGFFQTTPSPRAFGYPGAGGHTAFADPDARIGFAYVANQMKMPADYRDPRVSRILGALNECLQSSH